MIYVYLAEEAPTEGRTGKPHPEWVAYASHDFAGDDLRRRWDDPEVEKLGEHPVIYAGAGSHASYYARGEYLAELELPFLAPLVRLVDAVQALGRRLIRETRGEAVDAHPDGFNIFRIPFVDYARGDGRVIGLGGDRAWGQPILIDADQPWALNYRGLWGLYARDPIAGENAPAGPVYNRDGQMRRSWYDPLGWAGLDKVPPPAQAVQQIETQQAALAARRAHIEAAIDEHSRALTGLGVEAAAMVGGALAEALTLHAAEVQAGERGPLRAHLRRAHRPAPDSTLRLNRVAEFWAAISIGLMIIGFVGLVLFARHYLIFGLVALLSVIIFVEAGFRRQLARLVDSVTIALALVAALVLLAQWFWEITVVAVLVAGGYIMWENLRELRA